MHRLCAKPCHWVVRLFSKACSVPLPFSRLFVVHSSTVPFSVLSLKPHGPISVHSFRSRFNLDQRPLLEVILGCRMSSVFFPKPYRNELNQCEKSHCVQLAQTQKFDLKFTWPKVILWPQTSGVNKYMVWWVSTNKTQWLSNYCSSFLRSNLIIKIYRYLIWP